MIYVDISDVADEIRNNDGFNEFINKLSEVTYDYIGQSNDELTDEGKEFIKKLAKCVEELEKNNVKN